MNYLVPELIRKKRLGESLTTDEIHFLVSGFSDGSIPDYQASAWLMACFVKPLNQNETLELTRAMKNSGEVYDWSKNLNLPLPPVIADKHSTGGVGDKASLILAPLAAACGLTVPMMSGRGLGFTGGTVDKLESIPGFRMDLHLDEARKGLEQAGFCMIKQSPRICPADGKLYSLRDVTATVENVELISASIVSKKWASGVKNIVYDVKCGESAFMQTLIEARKLAKSLVTNSKSAGLAARAVISRMVEPLGSCVGNALEVNESKWILSESYPSLIHKKIAEPLVNLSVDLTAHMLELSGVHKNFAEAQNRAREKLQSGQALERFEKMMTLQAGNPRAYVDLPKAKKQIELKSLQKGFVQKICGRSLGLLGIEIGIGRQKADDAVFFEPGFEILCQVGDAVEAGQRLGVYHARNDKNETEVLEKFLAAFEISATQKEIQGPNLILEVVD